MFKVSALKERGFWFTEYDTHLNELFNKGLFRANDTPLTYRQINLLSDNELLHENRENRHGWRQLTIKDVIFTYLVFELRSFGLRDKQLKGLADSFYKRPSSPDWINRVSFETNECYATLALGLSLFKNKIYLFVDFDGSVDFCDQKSVKRVLNSKKSAIYINFSKIVMEVWGRLTTEESAFYYSIQDFIAQLYKEGHTVNEREEKKIKDMQDLLVDILLDSFIKMNSASKQSDKKSI